MSGLALVYNDIATRAGATAVKNGGHKSLARIETNLRLGYSLLFVTNYDALDNLDRKTRSVRERCWAGERILLGR
jgi:hypothetical protein